MRREDNPCYGCVAPKRHLGCHETCKEGKEYHEKWEAHKAKIRKAKAEEHEYTEYRESKHDRLKNWDKKGKH